MDDHTRRSEAVMSNPLRDLIRYHPTGDDMQMSASGDYVEYEDVLDLIEAQEKRIEELEAELAEHNRPYDALTELKMSKGGIK